MLNCHIADDKDLFLDLIKSRKTFLSEYNNYTLLFALLLKGFLLIAVDLYKIGTL